MFVDSLSGNQARPDSKENNPIMTARSLFAATLSATALTLVAMTGVVTPAAFAQDKMGTSDQSKMSKMSKMSDPKMGKMSDGKMMKSPVYVSKMTKMYYAEPDAKRMKMMDTKGNKLVKMEKAPAGFKMGQMGTGKMAPKMGKMESGKMSDGKMSAGKP